MTKLMTIARRNFFSEVALFASAALLFRSARAAADDAQRIGLGFSLYGMKSLAIADAVTELARIGYDCVELPVMPDWPADGARLTKPARRDLRNQLAERGLRLTALMENLPTLGDERQHHTNLERLKLAVELASDLTPDKTAVSAPAAPLIETILGGKPGEFEAAKERLVERLRQWADVAAGAKIVVAVKSHIGNAVQRPEQLTWLLDQVASPWLKAAYDYSHFQLQKLELGETWQTLVPQAVFIHVKDGELVDGKPRFLLPGEGTTNYAEMFKLIHQSPYRGDVVVEVSSQVFNRAGYEPVAAARKCYNRLAEAFSIAGLVRSK